MNWSSVAAPDKIRRGSAGAGPIRPKCGQTRPNLANNGPMLGCRSSRSHVSRKVDPGCPSVAEKVFNKCQKGYPGSQESARHRPEVVNFAFLSDISAGVGQTWQTRGRKCASWTICWSSLATPGRFRPNVAKAGPIRPKCGRIRPNLAACGPVVGSRGNCLTTAGHVFGNVWATCRDRRRETWRATVR